MQKILLIEDDPAINDLLTIHLSLNGFQVSNADCLAKARELLRNESYSMIVLDLSLPDGDGFSLIKEITDLSLPILVLTADDSIKRKVESLNLGADDYMTKPFEALELIARINAIMRRTDMQNQNLRIGESFVDLQKRRVLKNNEEVILTSKEWHLLMYLIRNRGFVLNREQLLKNVWGYDYYGNSRTIDIHIQKLRKKLETKEISTIFKEGYRLEA